MWTITSSASISTQSAAGSPSIRTLLAELFLDAVGELGRHRRHLPRRAARGDHHVVGDVRLARERDRHDLLRLVVVERLEHQLVELFDLDRRAAFGGSGSAGCSVKGSPGGRMARRLRGPLLARAERFGDTSLGSVRADSGCGRGVGRQAKEQDRRCTPLRPVISPGSKGRTNLLSQPIAHAAWALPIIARAANHRNRHFARQAPPIAPADENLADCRFPSTR